MKDQVSISRRGFLKRASAVTAGAITLPHIVPSSAFAAAPSNRLNFAIIGCGGQGTGASVSNIPRRPGGVLNAFINIPDVQVVATCDPFKIKRDGVAAAVDGFYSDKGHGSYKGCKSYVDFRDIMARDDIDGVIIATPDHWHVPMGIAAAKAGKDMYIEKPLGLTMEQNKAMRDAVHRYGAIFQYGAQQRGGPHCGFACELIRNGRIGQLKEIHVLAPGGGTGGSFGPDPMPEGFDYDMWLGPAPKAPYATDRCIGGGRWFMYDYSVGFLGGWGAHPLDLAHWGYPEIPVEFEGTGNIPKEGLFDTVSSWSIKGKYANGIDFTFGCGSDMTTFVGTEGWVKVSRARIDASSQSLLNSIIKPEEIHLQQNKNHYKNLVDCMKTRKQPQGNIDSAIQSDFISHLSDIAIRTGRKIKWDPASEQIVGDKVASRMMSRSMASPWSL